jgi:hypothetical protein
MNTKETALVVFTVILAGVYLCCFTDWLKNKPITVEHAVRLNVMAPNRRALPVNAPNPAPYVITFSLGREYKLTSVRVVPAAEFQTNRDVHPLWHLAGDARSDPVRFIVYGLPIPGMKPLISGTGAEPLSPGIEYKLIVEAGATRGEHNFKIAKSIASHR